MLLDNKSNINGIPQGEFVVTIPSGKVGSDLSDFPLTIDLSDMPSTFWDLVTDEGFNLAAYNADMTVRYPVDIAYCNQTAQTGFVFVKTDIAAASNTVVRLMVRSGRVIETDDATYGRNQVWSDYEMVYHLGADVSDRTGNHANLRMIGDPELLAEVATSGDINCHEGIATDGTYYYGFDSSYLRKFDSSWNSVLTSSDLTSRYSLGIGGGCVHDGIIYCAADDAGTQYLAKYDASDFSFIEDFDIDSFASGAADFCMVDGVLHTIKYDGSGTSAIIKIDPDTGENLGTIALDVSLNEAQGITFWRGAFWVCVDNTDETYRIEIDGTVNETGLFGSLDKPTTWEGIDVAPDGDGLILVDDTGTVEVVRTFKESNFDMSAGGGCQTFEPARVIGDFTNTGDIGTVWTVGISALQTTKQQTYCLGIVPTGGYSSTESVHIGVDQVGASTYKIAAFDGSNSWLYSGSEQQISDTEMKRINVAYNGTTARYMWVNGGDKETDSGITARGSGASHFVMCGSKEGTIDEAWIGKVGGYAYARKEILSDDWIAAEHDNLDDPSAFYTLATTPAFRSAPAVEDGDTLDFETDQDCTVYYVFVLRGASQPSDATIKAGFSLTISGGTGSGAADISGLTNGLYDLWYLASANGLDSAAAKAELTISIPIPATIPDAFAIGDWSVADAGTGGQLNVTIASLPDDGGDTITDVEYRIDSGSWVSSGGVVSFSITSLTDDTEVDIELQAVNGEGDSGAGDLKSATPTTVSSATNLSPNPITTSTFEGNYDSISGGVCTMSLAGENHFVWPTTANLADVTGFGADGAEFYFTSTAASGALVDLYYERYNSGGLESEAYFETNIDVSAGGEFGGFTIPIVADTTGVRVAIVNKAAVSIGVSDPKIYEVT